jgi:hypothetical protein
VTLAETHGGICRRAIDTLYEFESSTLPEGEADERHASDEELRAAVCERERRRRLAAEFEHAGELADSAVLALEAARTLYDHARSTLTRFAAVDPDLQQRLVALANRQGGVYAEALEALKDHPNAGDRVSFLSAGLFSS